MEADRTPGHFPVVLGLTLADAGWDRGETIAAFCYQTAIGFVSAALKLLPIGQREGQHLLERWTPLFDECAKEACGHHDDRLVAGAGYLCHAPQPPGVAAVSDLKVDGRL